MKLLRKKHEIVQKQEVIPVRDLKEIINKTKGTLSKKKVCDIIEKLD